VGVVDADALEAYAADVYTKDKFGVLANQPPIDDAAPPADDAAALISHEAAAEATAPCAPAGKASLTPAMVDPGATSTVTVVAVGKRVRIAACTAAVAVALSGLANVI
jgi:hypothetical protein